MISSCEYINCFGATSIGLITILIQQIILSTEWCSTGLHGYMISCQYNSFWWTSIIHYNLEHCQMVLLEPVFSSVGLLPSNHCFKMVFANMRIRTLFQYKNHLCCYKDPYYTDKNVLKPSWLYLGNLCTSKMASLYWYSPQGPITDFSLAVWIRSFTVTVKICSCMITTMLCLCHGSKDIMTSKKLGLIQ